MLPRNRPVSHASGRTATRSVSFPVFAFPVEVLKTVGNLQVIEKDQDTGGHNKKTMGDLFFPAVGPRCQAAMQCGTIEGLLRRLEGRCAVGGQEGQPDETC